MPEGKIHVDVLSAVEETQGHGYERQTFVVPVLRVTTWDARVTEAGYLKLRGKLYATDAVFMKMPWHGREWAPDHKYNLCRYRTTAAGNALDFDSPTGRKLNEITEAVRERFVTEHPEWEAASKRRRLDWQIKDAESKAADLFEQARKKTELAATLRAQRDALSGACSQCKAAHDRGDGRCERHGKPITR